MDPHTNFIAVLRDLERLGSSLDDYDLMRIPGILRLLLLDGLIHQVNREFRLQLRFRVGRTITLRRGPDGNLLPPVPRFVSAADGFDPAALAGQPRAPAPRDLSLDQLLASVIMAVEGEPVTVGDLIDHLAYVHGLVHPGQPKNPLNESLLGWRRTLQLGSHPAGLREIRSVARVVHAGLVPLRDALLAK
jgi:hypothetical protein